MYAFRSTQGPVDLAFTDRVGGVSDAPYDELNLALDDGDDAGARAENHRRLLADFGPGDELADLHQVHGREVVVLERRWTGSRTDGRPDADAVVTARRGVTLLVRAADCVPVLLADPDAGVIGAAHAGRPGLAAGVVPAAVGAMRTLGADRVQAWLGPCVCGSCYEVPAGLRDEVARQVPAARSTTSWGTPSLDLAAGIRAQLAELAVAVHDASRCTRESADLYSYRRDGVAAGRHAGLVRLRGGDR